MPLVVDASSIIPLCVPDETAEYSKALTFALGGTEVIVPMLWWYEIRNALRTAERRGRVTVAVVAQFLATVSQLPITYDSRPESAGVMALSREYGLSVYDAAYLELAIRAAAELATQDDALVKAARAAGVPVFAAAAPAA